MRCWPLLLQAQSGRCCRTLVGICARSIFEQEKYYEYQNRYATFVGCACVKPSARPGAVECSGQAVIAKPHEGCHPKDDYDEDSLNYGSESRNGAHERSTAPDGKVTCMFEAGGCQKCTWQGSEKLHVPMQEGLTGAVGSAFQMKPAQPAVVAANQFIKGPRNSLDVMIGRW